MLHPNKLVSGEPFDFDKFKDPSREFGIAPFWFVNGEMDYDEMTWQIEQFNAAGIPAIIFHSRFGNLDSIGYLTEDWLDRVRYAIRECERLGMQLWIYDEYNWPSGSVAQTIQKDDPELVNYYLELVETHIPGQFFTFMEGTDSRYNDLEKSEPIYACAILEEDLANGEAEFVNLMPSLSFDKVISWEAPPGPWKLYYFIRREADYYTDVLNPEVTRQFLERTHQRYKDYLGEDFDKVQGFYTDEPAMLYFETGRNNMVVPWTAQMFAEFRARNGYDLRPLLPHLYDDINEDTPRIRFDYWRTLTAVYEKSFYEQYADWCEENDVVFTGHLLYEESLRMHARTGGNLFHSLRHFDMTGVDHLYPRVGTREMPNEHVALKLASSAAHQDGSVRLLCESMGGLYWDTTLERMKWIADWEYVLGVNLLNPHGFHYSIEGERKRDWPPSQFYHHSWWPEYKDFNTYITRLSYMLSGGVHQAETAILYPMTSIWATYKPQESHPVGALIENEFNWLTDRLLRLHVDFDYVEEERIQGAALEDGRLVVGDEKYKVLILPAATHLEKGTLEAIAEFVKAGGTVIADSLLPEAAVASGEDMASLAEAAKELFGLTPQEAYERSTGSAADNLDFHVHEVGNGRAVTILGGGFNKNNDEAKLEALSEQFLNPPLRGTSRELFSLRRKKDEQELYFIVNSTDQTVSSDFTLDGEYEVVRMIAETGESEVVAPCVREDGKTKFSLTFAPYVSMVLALNEPTEKRHFRALPGELISSDDGSFVVALDQTGSVKSTQVTSEIMAEDGNVVTLTADVTGTYQTIDLVKPVKFTAHGDNTLSTDDYRVTPAEGISLEDVMAEEDFTDWWNFRMGAWALQMPQEWLHRPETVDLWYVADIEVETVPEKVDLLIDGFKGQKYELYLNGQEITEEPRRSDLDSEIGAVDVSKILVVGRNRTAVKLTVSRDSDGMTDLLKFVGDFGVRPEDDVITTIPETIEGPWSDSVWPYFSGSGVYSFEVDIPEELIGQQLLLHAEIGDDLFSAEVNQEDAGKCLWQPYTLDISDKLVAGKNTIDIRVVNTMVNMLQKRAQTSGLTRAWIEAKPLATFTYN